jgi:hypothetical protein
MHEYQGTEEHRPEHRETNQIEPPTHGSRHG